MDTRSLSVFLVMAVAALVAAAAKATDVDDAQASQIAKVFRESHGKQLTDQQLVDLKAATRERWPSQEAVACQAVEQFASLILRSTADDAYQQSMLTQGFALSGVELDRHAFARLNDLVELSHGRTQQFGSIIDFEHGKPVVRGGYELERANILRSQVALAPLLPFLEEVERNRSAVDKYDASRRISIEPPQEPELRLALLEAVDKDQSARKAPESDQNRLVHESDKEAVVLVDRVNARYGGFPPVSDVGVDGVHAFFLLSQHVLGEQRLAELLPQAERLMLAEELSRQDFALMSDRVLVYQKRPQLYGTQFESRNGTPVLWAISDPGKVNSRRQSMGLDPLPQHPE